MAEPAGRSGAAALTGRIDADPDAVIRAEVLEPQYRYEVDSLLPHYVAIEKVLAVEYHRLGLLSPGQSAAVSALLDTAADAVRTADPAESMTDIAFALERHVERGLGAPVPAWHVDRSRNDFQACAQLMHLKESVLDTIGAVLDLAAATRAVAGRHLHDPMPGYSHFQAAQIVSPGFCLAAFDEELLHAAGRLAAAHDGMDRCPLGAGAMAGQELAWDRARMADLLGFAGVQPSALTSVASRRAAAEATAELSLLGAAVSRFGTDLLSWAGGDRGFLDLPDELAGISSAMPQKKNFPVLERIRGRSAHLAAFHLDVLLGQRNTPYTNLVEVSKEAGTHVADAFGAAGSLLRLLTLVMDRLTFRTGAMRAACERDFFGGFTLANRLTLDHGVPWRTAQIIVGGYIRAAIERGLAPRDTAPDLLHEAAAARGVQLDGVEAALQAAFDPDAALTAKITPGSTHPDAVAELLRQQEVRAQELCGIVAAVRARGAAAASRLATGLADSAARD